MSKTLATLRHNTQAFCSRRGDDLRYFVTWLGPRRLLILIFALISINVGIGTLMGYSGSPTDAPHLLIPHFIRGWVWVITAVVAIGLLFKRKMGSDKNALFLLTIMPMVRLVSYLMAWALSIDGLPLFNDVTGLQGAPNALYTSFPYMLQILIIIAAGWAPARWSIIKDYLRAEKRDEDEQDAVRVVEVGESSEEQLDVAEKPRK